ARRWVHPQPSCPLRCGAPRSPDRLRAVVTRIVILGGGPAGYEAALVAATSHPETVQVTVIDSVGIGGAAGLDDCVPSQTFLASTRPRRELRPAPPLGFRIDLAGTKNSFFAIPTPRQ